MSLNCFPLIQPKTIRFKQQSFAIDSAYDGNLLLTVTNNFDSISVYSLVSGKLLSSFRVCEDVLIDEVKYCLTGDYIACLGHKDGLLSIYIASNWRESNKASTLKSSDKYYRVIELSLHVPDCAIQDYRSKLTKIDCCQKTGNLAASCSDTIFLYRYMVDSIHVSNGSNNEFCLMACINLSIIAVQISLVENYLAIAAIDHVQVLKLELLMLQIQQQAEFPNNNSENDWAGVMSNRKLVTWSLNTRKLVKLPTLMQTTSANLNSFHVCHPLELLGPASESIACRVNTRLYMQGYCQNQLEATVMLCRQFERDLVKSISIQPVYLPHVTDFDRLDLSVNKLELSQSDLNESNSSANSALSRLLESSEHKLLVSVNCVVTTLHNCYVYALQGKRVIRSQTIRNPDMSIDSRNDLLNVYILTSLGLQICSTSICDSLFKYDWTSSADLNLNFIATNRSRVLLTRDFVVLVPCSSNSDCCDIEYFKKPSLQELSKRIFHVVDRCDSISIRANLLTYLHATAQLEFMRLKKEAAELSNLSSEVVDANPIQSQLDAIMQLLQTVTVYLCKQMLRKKQTNALTNSKIDKAIRHLLETSNCNLDELINKLEAEKESDSSLVFSRSALDSSGSSSSSQRETSNNEELQCNEEESQQQLRVLPALRRLAYSSRNASSDELVKIYSKMLEDLSAHSTDDNSSFSASFARRRLSSTNVSSLNSELSANNDITEAELDSELLKAFAEVDICDLLDIINNAKDEEDWLSESVKSQLVEASLRLLESQYLFSKLVQR